MRFSSIKMPVIIIGAFILILLYTYGRSFWAPAYQKILGKQTVSLVIEKYGANAESRLKLYFDEVGVLYPPSEIKLLTIKDEKRIELWATNNNQYKKIKDYRILAASGEPGPKLQEGDKQVPEGIYQIAGLNPNSSFHLSIKLNYPNEFDLLQAKKDGRANPGSNIFIHGKDLSIGCLAIGDEAIEELFTLVHKTGKHNAEVIIVPKDPRKFNISVPKDTDYIWIEKLYESITNEFLKYQ